MQFTTSTLKSLIFLQTNAYPNYFNFQNRLQKNDFIFLSFLLLSSGIPQSLAPF